MDNGGPIEVMVHYRNLTIEERLDFIEHDLIRVNSKIKKLEDEIERLKAHGRPVRVYDGF